MDLFTQAVWEVITGSIELLEELTAIMRKEHKPFLTSEQAFEANTNLLKQQIGDKFTKWLAWHPTLPIDQIGCALAEEAIEFVERIDQRKELNRLYKDIKEGFINEDGVKCYIGSLVIVHEDRLFRDEFHTSDTTFMQLLAEHDVLLFVRTDHRRYDCMKPSDRNTVLEKMIASRSYLDDHVLGRMNGSQEAKALQGLFIGNNLPKGLVTKGKKKEQIILVYKLWAPIVLWMFKRFKDLDNLYKLGHEIEAMPFLFPDPPIEDFLQYTFKINMTKVPGGFKPTSVMLGP